MKPISLPITLLGRIAPLASKPSREELLKEVSTPITISDLMENKNWIEDAFAKAAHEVETAQNIRQFLDDNTPAILTIWSRVVGDDKAVKLAEMIAKTDDGVMLIDELTTCFAIAGYMLAKSEYEQDEE
jgi:hypothetical protein